MDFFFFRWDFSKHLENTKTHKQSQRSTFYNFFRKKNFDHFTLVLNKSYVYFCTSIVVVTHLSYLSYTLGKNLVSLLWRVSRDFGCSSAISPRTVTIPNIDKINRRPKIRLSREISYSFRDICFNRLKVKIVNRSIYDFNSSSLAIIKNRFYIGKKPIYFRSFLFSRQFF